jgi:predicted N-acetyltransferase YhbS
METKKNYVTRPYRPGDEEQIVQLLKRVFHDWPIYDFQGTAIDHWRWKYSDFPINHNMTIVAESDGKIIGTQHGIFLRIKIGNKRFISRKGADAAVHPDYRRMGVYRSIVRLIQKMLEDCDYHISYWLTSNPILLKMKWEGSEARPFPHPIVYLVRIHDIDKHLQHNENDRPNFVLKYGYFGAKALSKLEPQKTIKEHSEFKITDITRFGVEINRFWEQVKDGYDFMVEKTMDYLNWRYCDPRGGVYKVLLAKDEGQVIGFIVSKVNRYREEYPVGYIMEVLALPDRSDVVFALIENVVTRFDSMGVNVVHAQIVKGHPYEALLKRHGFVDARKKSFLSYSPVALGDELGRFANASPHRLHYQYGESDSI